MFPLSLDEWRSGGGPVLSGEGRRVDFDWVREALESGRTDTIVVDVRRDQERTDPGYIPGAKHVPRKKTMLHLPQKRSKTIQIYSLQCTRFPRRSPPPAPLPPPSLAGTSSGGRALGRKGASCGWSRTARRASGPGWPQTS